MIKEGGPEADDTLGSSTRMVARVACANMVSYSVLDSMLRLASSACMQALEVISVRYSSLACVLRTQCLRPMQRRMAGRIAI